MVLVHAGGVGIARDVQPVPAPALAVLRRGEQPVDHLRECVRRIVGQKFFDLLGVGGRPVRSKVTRRSSVSFDAGGAGLNALLFQLRQDEPIDRDSAPMPRSSPRAAAYR